MILASVLNAKVHLFSGLVFGALVVAAAGQMKRGCRRYERKNNASQPSSSNN